MTELRNLEDETKSHYSSNREIKRERERNEKGSVSFGERESEAHHMASFPCWLVQCVCVCVFG